jgi:hypothetical protein
MTKVITYDEALDALTKLVAKNPNRIYRSTRPCVYSSPSGRASCGVGHVIKKLRPELFAAIHIMEYESAADPSSCTVEGLVHSLHLESAIFEPDALYLLAQFQQNQDAGTEYGIALVRARESARRVSP